MILVVGDIEIDTGRYEIRRDGRPVPVEPQVFDVIVALATAPERVVTKEELLDGIWGDRFVGESALTSRVKAARRALGDDGRRQGVIRTIRGRGYRFVAPVVTADVGSSQRASGASTAPPGPVRSWPLVGREREVGRIAAAFGDGTHGGVLVTGPAGVGKTRLADEAARLVAGDDVRIHRAGAHLEATPIPLAAIAHLLPGDVTARASGGLLDRRTVFDRARAAFGSGAGVDGPDLLVVDDADHLDELSTALLTSLVQDRVVFAVLTMRTRPDPVPALEQLVRDGHLARLDLGSLTDAQLDELVHGALDGPVVADTRDRIVAAAGGSPGLLRSMVEAAIESGSLVEERGVWRLVGPLLSGADLAAVVAGRLDRVPAAARQALELVAIAGRIGLEIAGELVGPEPLAELGRRGLVDRHVDGRRTDVTVSHPLYAESLLGAITPLRGRRLRRELADAVERRGARRREDGVRLVAWRLDGGGAIDPKALVDAAAAAFLERDVSTAERLVESAAAGGSTAEIERLRAEVCLRRGDIAGAEAILAAIDLDRLDEATRAETVRRRSNNLYYGLGDLTGAVAACDAAVGGFARDEARHVVETNRAMVLAMGGRVDDAVAATGRLLDVSGHPRLEMLRARALGLAAQGRGDEALELIAEGRSLHATLPDHLAGPGRSVLLFAEAFALTELGRLNEARELVDTGRAREPSPAARHWLGLAGGRLELIAGRPAAARRYAGPVVTESRAVGADPTERWALGLVGASRLIEGAADAATPDVERMAELLPADGRGLFVSDMLRAGAWLRGARDGPEQARAELAAAIERIGGRGALVHEAAILHDVVRFGDPGTVADRMAEMARRSDGELVALRAAHARAAADGSVEALAGVVDGFERIGAGLLATDAAADMALAARRRGDLDGARRAAARARSSAGPAGARLVTPALVRLDRDMPIDR